MLDNLEFEQVKDGSVSMLNAQVKQTSSCATTIFDDIVDLIEANQANVNSDMFQLVMLLWNCWKEGFYQILNIDQYQRFNDI
ncbi:unnamed protein product [Paramecium octaurelia]|uniref:Uncharacterized protein n=1 Tax=Paramecium octaurelia TaxID=43137 RepID=A0A8S1XLD7_PAROT|nr:unnamed protein product [Paramecium octaurelia]